ncbi:MAG: hypothetical protein ACYDEC_03510 [Bacteroidia bacterium]
MDYIGKTDPEFDSFQSNFMTIIQAPYRGSTNIVRWKLDPVEVADLVAYQTNWNTDYAAGGETAKTTRNTGLTNTKTASRKSYENNQATDTGGMGLRAYIAARILHNPFIADADRIVMRVPVHKKTRTKHTVATKNRVVFKTSNIGGAMMHTPCHSSGTATGTGGANTQRTGKQTNRPKKEPGYDIMKSWKLIKKGAELPKTPNDPGMTHTLFTKANIKHQLPLSIQVLVNNVETTESTDGWILCEFLQWFITKHPDLAGPISTLQTTTVAF